MHRNRYNEPVFESTEEKEMHKHFTQVYKGQGNFMTPNLQEYRKKDNLIIEISSGKGIWNDIIWGVTVLKVDNHNKNPEKTDLNRGGFTSMREVDAYIEGLGN